MSKHDSRLDRWKQPAAIVAAALQLLCLGWALAIHPAIADTTAEPSADNSGRRAIFVPPRVLRRWIAHYPLEAYDAAAEGEAFVLVNVGADGSLINAQLDRSSGNAALDRATLDAVRRYTFTPGKKNGFAIPSEAIVSIDWRITAAVKFEMTHVAADTRERDVNQTKHKLELFSGH